MKVSISFLAKILFRVIVLIIFLCNFFVLCLYTYLSFFPEYDFALDIQQPVWFKVGLVVLLPTVFVLAVFLYWPGKEKKTAILSKRSLYRKILTVVSVSFFLFLVIDARKPEYHYSINDITLQGPEVHVATVLLNKLYHGQGNIPDLSFIKNSDEYSAIGQYTAEIRSAWREIRELRGIVERLASYDRTRHVYDDFGFVNREIYIRRVALIYHCNSLLLAQEGNVEKAVADLCLFHAVTRKALQGSVNFIQKMIWGYISGENLRTAYQLAYQYPLNEELLHVLAEAFIPLTMDEVSFHKPWIGEYLLLQEQVELSFFKLMQAKYYEPEQNSRLYEFASFFPESFINFLYRLILQKNRTSKQIAAFWEPIIKKSHDNVVDIDAVNFQDVYSYLPIRNLGGWCFHKPPVFLDYTSRILKIKVQSDLFAKYLYSRLGMDVHVYSYYINDRTRILENSDKLISAGEDRRFGSDDDVTLEVYYP